MKGMEKKSKNNKEQEKGEEKEKKREKERGKEDSVRRRTLKSSYEEEIKVGGEEREDKVEEERMINKGIIDKED